MRIRKQDGDVIDVTNAGYVHVTYKNPAHRAGYQTIVMRIPAPHLRHLFVVRTRGADSRRSPFGYLHVMDDFGTLVYIATVDLNTLPGG